MHAYKWLSGRRIGRKMAQDHLAQACLARCPAPRHWVLPTAGLGCCFVLGGRAGPRPYLRPNSEHCPSCVHVPFSILNINIYIFIFICGNISHATNKLIRKRWFFGYFIYEIVIDGKSVGLNYHQASSPNPRPLFTYHNTQTPFSNTHHSLLN